MYVIRACALLLVLILAVTAPGCAKKGRASDAPNGSSVKEAIVTADPQTAVDKIYLSLKEYKANPVSLWQLEELLGIKAGDVEEFYGKISDPTGGLADVLILLPKSEKREDVQLALSKYKEQRMAEFEDYDILDAYPISQNAAIYDQGDYTILLMLADNDAARTIIDAYIPL